MKIAVIGAGAIGSLVGGLLARAGEDVTLIGRPTHVQAVNAHGLIIDGALGRIVVQVPAREQLTFAPDLALLAVKTQHLAAAVAENRASIQDATILTLQNGVQADQVVGDLLGTARLYSAVVVFAATFLEPGRVTYPTLGSLVVGKVAPPPDPATLHRLVATLAKALPTVPTANVAGAHWAKLIINENNALPAVTGLSIQEVNRRPLLRRLSVLMMQETLAAYRAAGIVPAPLPGVPLGLMVRLLRLPPGLAQFWMILASRRLGRTPVFGSTLQSVKRGEKTEIDYLNGEVVTLGRRTGTPTPYNSAVVAMVHQVEAQQAFLPVAQLESLVTKG